jgi:hypothetical protein
MAVIDTDVVKFSSFESGTDNLIEFNIEAEVQAGEYELNLYFKCPASLNTNVFITGLTLTVNDINVHETNQDFISHNRTVDQPDNTVMYSYGQKVSSDGKSFAYYSAGKKGDNQGHGDVGMVYIEDFKAKS